MRKVRREDEARCEQNVAPDTGFGIPAAPPVAKEPPLRLTERARDEAGVNEFFPLRDREDLANGVSTAHLNSSSLARTMPRAVNSTRPRAFSRVRYASLLERL